MDCRRSLRGRARRVGSVSGKTDGAQTGSRQCDPTSGQTSPTATPAILAPSPSPLASPEAAPQGAESGPTFAEKVETLRNSDVELRFTNRGGGIAEAVMFNHIGEDAKPRDLEFSQAHAHRRDS